MTFTILLFTLGFVLLIAGANFLIKGASLLGKKYKVPSIVIGMVVVGFGTSIPELIISVVAVFKGSPEISISNVVGSNIANIMIVLGILALISNIKVVRKHTIHFKIPFVIFSSIVLLFMVSDRFLGIGIENVITRTNGIIFLLLFVFFLYYTLFVYKETPDIEAGEVLPKSYIIFLMIAGGIAGVTFGGNWVVENAIMIAEFFGISEGFIGLSLLAIGSSLPEVISSVAAVIKKEEGLALGNIIGSNIFNTFMILGIAAVIEPLPVSPVQHFNIIVNVFASILFLLFVLSGKNGQISKIQGVMLLLFYIAFIIISASMDTSTLVPSFML
jgi:cation:H+ antiporter